MRSIKGIIILSIIALSLSLSVGYASITASLKQNKKIMNDIGLDVEVTSVEIYNRNGSAIEGKTEFKGSIISFSPMLSNGGDSITYVVTLTNKSNNDLILDNVIFDDKEGGNPQIYFTSTTPKVELKAGETTSMYVIAAYDQTNVSGSSLLPYKETECIVTYIEK